MKKSLYSLLFCAIALATTAAAKSPITIAKMDADTIITGQPQAKDIYKYLREPNAVVTNNGTLIVIWGPHHIAGKNDRAHQDLICRTSKDEGKTWSDTKMIADEGMHSLLPSCLVYDKIKNRTHLLINVIYNAPGQSKKGCRQFVMHSDDDGQTWSKRREIFKETAAICVFGGGGGFQVEHGPNKGRLIVPGGKGRNFLFFSDDHGQNWQMKKIPSPGRKEATATELQDGTLLVSNRGKGFGINLIRSRDGGINWNKPETILPDAWAACNNSMLAIQDSKGREILLYLAPVGPNNADKYTLEKEAQNLKRGVEDSLQSSRMNGTLFYSRDGGEKWRGLLVTPNWIFGYNALVQFKSGDIGIIFEGAPASQKGWKTVKRVRKDHNTGSLLGIHLVKIPLAELL